MCKKIGLYCRKKTLMGFLFLRQTHYKQKSRIFGSQSRLRDSKPHNNVLHAFCGIETIELPLRSSHKKSVFEPRPAPSRKHYGKAFIMRLPCVKIYLYLLYLLKMI